MNRLILLAAVSLAGGCGGEELLRTATTRSSFAAWRDALPKDDTGAYLVEGDIAVRDEDELETYFAPEGALTVITSGSGSERSWGTSQKYDLTYCVSFDFDGHYQAVIDAMAQAAAAWHEVAEVRFVYVQDEDWSCNSVNTNVVFNVRPGSGDFQARAFWPNDARSAREIIITDDGLCPGGARTLTGILMHELGHTLGFRHEHIWDGNCGDTTLDTTANAIRLTAHDTSSVMYYTQCPDATNDGDFYLTDRDALGAACKYNLSMRRSACDASATINDYIWFSNGASHTFWSSPFNLSGLPHPIAGDFDGDGRDDIFWYGRGNRPDAIWWGRTDGSFDPQNITVSGLYEPFTGDFDGDGRGDIFWYGGRSRADYIWYGNRDRTFTSANVSVGGAYIPVAGNFDGQYGTDILWYGPGNSTDSIWWSNGNRTFTSEAKTIGGNAQPFTGDFDGNGADDLIFFNPGTASDPAWFGARNRQFNILSWDLQTGCYPIVGNFDHANADDIFWYCPGPSQDAIWWNSPSGFNAANVTVNGFYTPVVGDFSGDHNDDILWFSPAL